MGLQDLPPQSSWVHRGAREGFEVLFASRVAGGPALAGHTAAVEDGVAWSVGYEIRTDDAWCTVEARVTGHSSDGERRTTLRREDGDTWTVDGVRRPDIDGCVDVDLESSAVTNTLPVHRHELPIGKTVSVPAAFVRAHDLSVQRLEQTYTRLDDDGRYAYTSSTFDFACELRYDAAGLIVEYPSIAVRTA